MTAAPESANALEGTPGGDLRRRREALSLTREQLAAALGCSASGLGNAETGTRSPCRGWWQRADGMLGAGGALLRLYDFGPERGPVWPAWGESPSSR